MNDAFHVSADHVVTRGADEYGCLHLCRAPHKYLLGDREPFADAEVAIRRAQSLFSPATGFGNVHAAEQAAVLKTAMVN